MPWSLRRAATVIKNGGVIAYPTEAVYGLGCHPLNEAAVNHLLQLKQRDIGKGLILISDTLERLEPFLVPLSESERQQITSHPEKPTTWLVPVQDWVPTWLTGWHGTLAVRVTNHPVASKLCQLAGMPIVSTSANIAGRAPARTNLQIKLQFGEQLDAIVVGKINSAAQPSTIQELKSGQIIRSA